MTALRPPFRRMLAVTLLATLLLAGWRLAVEPVWSAYAEGNRRIEDARRLFARYQAAAAERAALEEAVHEMRRRAAGHRVLFDAANEGLAAADLQTRIKALVERNGGELKSLQVLPAQAEAGLRRVGVRAILAADMTGLRSLLHAIEAGRPFLFVDSLDVRPRSPRAPGDGPEQGRLDVRLDLHGYIKEATP